MKRICKQCGAEFILTQEEIAFYKSKNLHIPKRCEKCRMENKMRGKTDAGAPLQPAVSGNQPQGNEYENVTASGQEVRAYKGAGNGGKKSWAAIAAVLVLLAVGIAGLNLRPGQSSDAAGGQLVQTAGRPEALADNTPAAEETESAYTYTFRGEESLQEHFEKHGAEFGYASAEEYLAGANRVIASPEALHKLEAEDGDDVYYLETTNEFVIVSTKGYIRTYFKPSDGKAYYDRQ